MMRLKSGFTLLEVLLVTVFLAALGLGTWAAVRDSVRTKEIVDYSTESMQGSRALLAMLDRDIRSAFFISPEDLKWEPLPPDPQNPLPPPVRPRPIYIFQASSTEMFFSATSHQRLSAESPENEHHFVTYQLIGQELIRAESPRAVRLQDRESPRTFRQNTLLGGVQKVLFEYYDSRRGQWVPSWDTEKQEMVERLPAAVRFEIEYIPDVDFGDGREPAPVRVATAVRIIEAAFKTYEPRKRSARAAPPGPPGAANEEEED